MTCCWAPWGHPGGESGRAGTSRRQWPSPWPEAFFHHDHNDDNNHYRQATRFFHVTTNHGHTVIPKKYRRYLVHTCTHHVHFFALALWNPSFPGDRFTESEHSNLSAQKIQIIAFGWFWTI